VMLVRARNRTMKPALKLTHAAIEGLDREARLQVPYLDRAVATAAHQHSHAILIDKFDRKTSLSNGIPQKRPDSHVLLNTKKYESLRPDTSSVQFNTELNCRRAIQQPGSSI
jgi:hypothetical protein